MNRQSLKAIRNGAIVVLFLFACWQPSTHIYAGATSQALKAAHRLVAGKAATQGVKHATQAAGKHVSTKVAKESAGAAARRTASNASRHFGKAASVASKNSATRSVRFADEFAVASSKLTPQNQRRLLMLAPDLEAAGKSGEVIHLLAKGGKADEVLEFLWRNKGTIVGGAAVSAVLANPDKVLAAGGEYVVKPVIKSTISSVAVPTLTLAAGIGSILLVGGLFTVAVAAANSSACRKAFWSLCAATRLAFQRAITK